MRGVLVVLLVAGLVPVAVCKRRHEVRTWTRTFGGPRVETGYGVQQTADGGYIVVGRTDSYGAGAYDVWLVRTDADGDSVWTRTFGGADDDWGRAVQQTSDGGFIVAGCTKSHGAGRTDVWLVKTDAEGKTVWDRAFGGTEDDMCYSVQQARDGGYVLAGFTRSYGAGEDDVWLIKTDANGDAVWTRTYGGTGTDLGSSVQQTLDGGYVVTGLTEPYRECCDVWLLKTDANGETAWTRTFGGPDVDEGSAVQQTDDGAYVITGSTELGVGNAEVWLVRTDTIGDTVWTKTFGGMSMDRGLSVQQTTDGGYVVVGRTWSSGAGGRDVWLLRTDASGNEAWARTMGGMADDEGRSVQQAQDGGYIIAGMTSSYGAGRCDVWLMKTDAEGRVDEGGWK